MKTLEEAFAEIERTVGPFVKTVSALQAGATQLLKAARVGDVVELRRSLGRLTTTLETLQEAAARLRSSWPTGDSEEERYIEHFYEDELIAHLNKAGLPGFRHGADIMAFPFVLKVLPKERALRINGKKTTILRPSAVVSRLEGSRKPEYTTERFLESLFAAYRVLTREERLGRPVTLRALYEVLTLLPSAESLYPEAQFVRDIYAVDSGAIRQTKSGATVNLVGSTGTKSKKDVYAFVGPDGDLVEYYGLQFTEDQK